MGRLPTALRGPVAGFHLALLALAGVLALLPPRHPEALPGLVGLGTVCAVLASLEVVWWPVAWGVGAAALTPWTGEAHSSLLLCLLGPAVPLGLAGRRAALALTLGLTTATLALAGALHGLDDPTAFSVAGAQWLLLSTGLAVLVLLGRRVGEQPVTSDDYEEVRELLEQLRSLTRHLPGGLDAVSTAEALLDRCSLVLVRGRSAVVVAQEHGAFVPLAVRGAQRVPWRDPLEQDGPLRRAWETGRAVVDRRKPDVAGRRRGSTLLAVPLVSGDGPFGLVILESPEEDAFDAATVATVEGLVEESCSQLETALLFEEVKLQATTEERDRIARQMHDGIAQELASFGYALDDLRIRAGAVDKDFAADVVSVRGRLTELVSELRLSITDLRTSLRPDRGLGAALGTYLRAVCAGKDVVLTLQLHETAFRLPAEQEVALFKAAQAFAQEVRRAPAASALVVHLVVDPPSALLSMACDSGDFEVALGDAAQLLARIGAVVTTSPPGEPPRLSVELRRSPE